MQVILLERIGRLGQMGDIVTVKDGFARNYLLPQGKALRATEANRKRFERERSQLEARDLEPIIARERAELARREQVYRRGRPPLALDNKTVILLDDGIATGSTMRAAVAAARALRAQRVIVAAPTASRQAVEELERSADLVAVLAVPEPYDAVGKWYERFPQLDDREVIDLLSRHERELSSHPH